MRQHSEMREIKALDGHLRLTFIHKKLSVYSLAMNIGLMTLGFG